MHVKRKFYECHARIYFIHLFFFIIYFFYKRMPLDYTCYHCKYLNWNLTGKVYIISNSKRNYIIKTDIDVTFDLNADFNDIFFGNRNR